MKWTRKIPSSKTAVPFETGIGEVVLDMRLKKANVSKLPNWRVGIIFTPSHCNNILGCPDYRTCSKQEFTSKKKAASEKKLG